MTLKKKNKPKFFCPSYLPPLCSSGIDYIQILETIFFISYC